MFIKLVLIFTLVPLIELALLIRIGARIGVMPTLLIVVLTGVIGAILAKYEGLRTWYAIQAELAEGRAPTGRMFDGFLIFAGGLLLLTPGFLTDIAGFLLLVPVTRDLVKYWLARKLNEKLQSGRTHNIRIHRRF